MKKMVLGALALSIASANAVAANEVDQLRKQLEAQQAQIDALADALENKGSATGAEWFNKTSIGGYGEHHWNRKKDGTDEVDAHRYVLFIGHEFTDTVRFFSEFELEHGLAGDGDDKPGEVELEQAYIEWDYTSGHSVVIGQFLVPVGIMNETHEPDTFYGVERNSVEKSIIPATWWETGVMIHGELAEGLSYNLAYHSGLEASGARNGKPFDIRKARQKSASATAEDTAYTARVKYTGVKGLDVGLTYQHQTDIGQGLTGEDNAADLVAVHAVYNVGGFGMRALWTEWDIDGDIPEASGQDQQEGYYVEGSYKVLPKLGVFARFEEYDTKAGDDTASEVEVSTVGLNYWLADTVVLKVDYQDQDKEPSGGTDSVNFGVGWSY